MRSIKTRRKRYDACDELESVNTFEVEAFRSAPKPTANPAERIAVGKEEQRNERTLTFYKKVGASDMQLAPTW